MDITTTTETASNRARNGSVILTDRMCEKRVMRRIKIYDRKCPGLYVSITTAGAATFSFKFTDPETSKQRTGWLGVYNPETFTVENVRSSVYAPKAPRRRGGCRDPAPAEGPEAQAGRPSTRSSRNGSSG
jgi:hypothetical protein